MELEGRVALVTGASRGIGREIALALAERGASVVISARTLEPGGRMAGSLAETAEAIRSAHGTDVHTVQCDLNDVEHVGDLADAALAWKGHVDVLVNNAAFLGKATFHSVDHLTLVNWQRQLNVNVTAPFVLIKALVPSMRAARRGVVANLTSNAGEPYEGIVPGIPYGATKAALNRLTIALARDLRDDGIAVFAVDPGHVRTEIAEQAAEHTGWDIDIDDAHSPAVAAAAVCSLIERDLQDVSARIFEAMKERPPLLRHDGRGLRPDPREVDRSAP